jgi:hypothetical protein
MVTADVGVRPKDKVGGEGDETGRQGQRCFSLLSSLWQSYRQFYVTSAKTQVTEKATDVDVRTPGGRKVQSHRELAHAVTQILSVIFLSPPRITTL